MRSLKIKNSKGFTLTEIVLLLLVIGIMISGILPVFLNVITANKHNNYQSIAYKLADSRLEKLRSGSFDDINTQTIAVSELPGGQIVQTVSQNIQGTIQPDLKRINVEVRWNYKRAHKITIETYQARGGIR